jgi:hypothetical protein
LAWFIKLSGKFKRNARLAKRMGIEQYIEPGLKAFMNDYNLLIEELCASCSDLLDTVSAKYESIQREKDRLSSIDSANWLAQQEDDLAAFFSEKRATQWESKLHEFRELYKIIKPENADFIKLDYGEDTIPLNYYAAFAYKSQAVEVHFVHDWPEEAGDLYIADFEIAKAIPFGKVSGVMLKFREPIAIKLKSNRSKSLLRSQDSFGNDSPEGYIESTGGSQAFFWSKEALYKKNSAVTVRLWPGKMYEQWTVCKAESPVRSLGSGEIDSFIQHLNLNGRKQ